MNKLLFFLILFLGLFNNLYSCYFENYPYFQDSYCSAFRDYQPGYINITNLTLITNYTTNAPDHFIYTFKNGKRLLLALKFIKENNKSDFWTYIYEYKNKKFEYYGAFFKGFIDDVNNDKNFEIIYGNPLENNEVKILNSQIQKTFYLSKNETFFYEQKGYLFTFNYTNTSVFLNVYRIYINNLNLKYSINVTKDKIEKIFVDKDQNLYLKYNGEWYEIKSNNKSKWVVKEGYPRDENIIIDEISKNNWIINLVKDSIIETDENENEPLFSKLKFNLVKNGKKVSKNLFFYLSNIKKKLYIVDLDKKELLKEIENVSWFSLNKDYLFIIKNNGLYYSQDLNNFYKIAEDIERIYTFDLNNDGKSEILALNDKGILILGNVEKPKVNYFVKNVVFPKPYTTYSDHFNFTVCSKGQQVIPLDIRVNIFHNTSKLNISFNFLNQYIDANSCRNYKIDFIPQKKGIVKVTIKLFVNDSNTKDNIFTINKEIVHDFIGLLANFTGDNFTFTKSNWGFKFIDLNDDLSDGYESINISYPNCDAKKIDYNSDNLTDYLIECSDVDYYLVVDPYYKKIGKASKVKDEDFYFYISIFNNTYSYVLPWRNWTGIEENYKKDNFNLNICLVDFNLDKFYDFLIYPSSVGFSKELTDYKIIGQNFKLENISIEITDSDDKFIEDILIPIYYKGLFNESETFNLVIFDNTTFIKTGEDIIQSQTPYNNFNLINKQIEFSKFKFSNNQIKIINKKDYNKTDNKVAINFCDLKIKRVELSNSSFIEVDNPCNKSYILVIKSIRDNQYFDILRTNLTESIFYINKSLLDKNMLFMVYYPNILDNDYSNNIRRVNFDISKLISLNIPENIVVPYLLSSIKFSLTCLREFNLNLTVFCDKRAIYNESLLCKGKKEFNIPYLFVGKDHYCFVKVKNSEINLESPIKLRFEDVKEIKKLKIDGNYYLLFEYNNNLKAFNFKTNQTIDVCKKEIDENNFNSLISLNPSCLNIVEIVEPPKLMIKKIETKGLVIKKGDKYVVYTFDPEIKIITKAIAPITKEEKEKYGVQEEVKPKENPIKKFVVVIFLVLFLGSSFSLLGYYLYNLRKKAEIKKQKLYISNVYQEKLKKEQEKKKRLAEILKIKQEKLIEEEAKSLLSWIKFLLNSYDEKEIYNYLLKKGYNKEVIEKAFELYRKEKGL